MQISVYLEWNITLNAVKNKIYMLHSVHNKNFNQGITTASVAYIKNILYTIQKRKYNLKYWIKKQVNSLNNTKQVVNKDKLRARKALCY